VAGPLSFMIILVGFWWRVLSHLEMDNIDTCMIKTLKGIATG
jgi:hypothetical protein